ncbi:hypothetical protein IM511_10120 [Erythrobacteraceae bacterium E2-1 Yellow Sea]|nr:hypothetical protein [Erythrobacteraceae bacterium E2-1 Yellow Sea]
MAANTFEFYDARANAAAIAAEQATLENVRERELRAEKTWRALAHQAQAVAVQRVKVEREKAEQREAAAIALADGE